MMLRAEYAKMSRFLLIVLMVFLCCLCLSAEAEIINGLTIEDKNGVRTVTAFDGSATEVVVPEGVEAIDNYVFQNQTRIASVSLPDSLKSIGVCAFDGCTKLGSIILPEEIINIRTMAFDYNTDLYVSRASVTAKALALPKYGFIDTEWPDFKLFYENNTVTNTYHLGLDSYINKNQKQVYVPDGIEIIGPVAFIGIQNGNRDTILKEIFFPSTVTELRHAAICHYEALEQVHLPENISVCYEDTFLTERIVLICAADSLTAHTLSDSGFPFTDPNDPDWAWRYGETGELLIGGYNGKEPHIALPAELTGIADRAFRHNEVIQSVIIPNGYTHIEDEAFAFSSIESIHFPESLLSIGEEAFAGCDISMLQLPQSLKTIGKEAFRNCWNLKSLTIPKSVTNIPYCIADESVTTVVLPKELTEIADNAFGDYVKTVYCYRNSAAHTWATQKGLAVKLLDNLNFSNLVTLTVDQPELHWGNKYIFEVGTTDRWIDRVHINLLPPDKRYTFRCTSSDPSIAKVEGNSITFLREGTVTLLYSIAELPSKVFGHDTYVYKPVVSYDVPNAILLPIHGASVEIQPQNVVPQGANPYYYWEPAPDTTVVDTTGKLYFFANNESGVRDVTVYSASGISRNVRLIDYETISTITATTPARKLRKGELYQPLIIVKVDDFYYNEPILYTLTSSNTSIVKPMPDGRLQAVSAGTANITAKAAVSGKTTTFTVTVSEGQFLILPTQLTRIEANAFVGIAAKTIVLPEGCTAIGSRAFADCIQLEEIIIPSSVVNIANDAFEGCAGVTVFAPFGSPAQTFAENTEGLTWQEDI